MEQLASLWPELVATTVGVLLGGIGALALARWQLRRQSSEERVETGHREVTRSRELIEALDLVDSDRVVSMPA